MKHKGEFIVLEGTDGSGKTEQFKRLIKRLRSKGHNVKTVDFPQYGLPSAHFVEQYLQGKYGSWKQVGPYKASVFYALDRFATASQIKKWISQEYIVLSNRYVASNLGHQGVKIKTKKARETFFHWVNNLEYNILSIPKPDINIFLHMPTKIAYDLIAQKGAREYLGNKKRDIHEQDITHLQAAENVYKEIVKLFPQDFKTIECVLNNKLLSIDEVAEKVWQTIKRFLK
ncbi:hypothetical protein MYX06_02780 [Patescibacteria group bacterium AH-259-L05]|nr:hypothetical protein [Patescibacteria group bacterium AH-259-L05]